MGIACTEPALDPSAKSQSCTESRKIPRQELWCQLPTVDDDQGSQIAKSALGGRGSGAVRRAWRVVVEDNPCGLGPRAPGCHENRRTARAPAPPEEAM